MNRSSIPVRGLFVAVVLVMSPPSVAHADPVSGNVRIGTLSPVGIVSPEEGLREGLRALGYIEGRNLTIESKRADSPDALRSAAADLVRSKVDVIMAFGTPSARAALSATSSVPVVFISGDPVATGLATSLARPGANATGVSSLTTELLPKRLELLQQIVPHVRRVFLLVNPSSPLHAVVLQHAQQGASALRIQIIALEARNAQELETALREFQRHAADALMVSPEVLFLSNKAKVAQAAAKARLPAIFPWPDYHDAGVLMSYGASTREMGLRAAGYVDRILRGAKPADLPIEQISKYELVIDLRAARELGIKVPQDLLLRADEVIR